MAVVYLGFLTHYYFAVYLFFLAAAMELYLLLERAEQKSWGQKWKDCLIYATAVIGAMLLAVVSYPACLSHIFRGYRGTEAMGAFFDLGNTLEDSGSSQDCSMNMPSGRCCTDLFCCLS